MFKQKIDVPNKLSEITLGQYQKFSKIFTEDTDQDFLQKKMVEIFCGIPLAEVNKIKYSSVRKVVDVISNMFNEKPKLRKIFSLGGKEFGFHPQLSEMSFGEFVDADTFTGDWQTMDKAMSVLYRPVKDKFNDSYLIEEYDGKTKEYMKQMPLDVAFGAIFFLSNLRNELMRHILNFSAKKMKKMTTQQQQLLERNGGGIAQCIASLERTSRSLTKWKDSELIPALHG